jgi:Amt family ammonium transporter
VLGMISGAVAGLGTITPASGFVAPWHGIIIGAVAGGVCYWACTWLKHRFNYDDSLDVFGVHGIGGMTGTLLCGVFATASIGGTAGLLEGHPQQVLIQLYGIAVTLVWSAGVTYALLKLVGIFVPLRVSREQEMEAWISRSMARPCSNRPSKYHLVAFALGRIVSESWPDFHLGISG